MRSLLLLTLVITSCADGNPSTMVILGNRAFESGCTLSSEESGVFTPLQYDLAETLPNGSINLGLTAHPLVKSLISDLDDQEDWITFSYADVEIVATNYTPSQNLVAALQAAQLHRHSPPVEGAAIEEGGTSVTNITLITEPMRQVLAESFPDGENVIQVEARVTIHGMIPGNDIESSAWRIPITLYPAGSIVRDGGDCCLIDPPDDEVCDPFVQGVTCCETAGFTYCPAITPDSCM